MAAPREGLPAKGLSWGARRPTAAAAVVYLVLAFAMFAPALVPGQTLSASDYLWTSTPWEASRPAEVPVLGSNRELTDSVLMWQHYLQYTRSALPDIPLWNPHIMGGRPFHGNLQSATLSPFSVPAYVLPFWDSLALMAALKLFVAALGTFLLGRQFGMRFGGALLAGLVFGFSLWSVTWVSWTTMSVWALLPWVCLLAERCVRRPGLLPFAGLAALVGLQFFAGHPTSSFHLIVFVALFWGARVLVSPELRRDRALLRLAGLGGALVAGTALAAITLLPFFELLDHSIDRKIRAGEFADSHAPRRYLLGLFFPDWWGRSSRTPLEFAAALEEHAYYVAALPLMLAGTALALRPSSQRIVVAVIAVVALATATGIPPFFDLVQKLPGFEAVRNGRLAVWTVLCVALLAGWGLDDLTGPEAPARRRRIAAAIGLGLLTLPIVTVVAAGRIDPGPIGDALRVALGFASATTDLAPIEGGQLADIIRLASLLQWGLLAGAALLLLLLRLRGRLGSTAFVALAALLVVLDLFKAGMGYNPAIEERHAEQPTTPAIRFLQSQRPARFAGLEPTTPLTFAVPMTPSVAMRYELLDARGLDYPVEERYAELWRRVITPSKDCNYAFCPESAASTPRALHALGLFGVTHLLQHRRDPPLSGFKAAYSGRDARIYENPRALPRAFLVDRQVTAPSPSAARETVAAADFPTRTVAVTEEPVSGLSQGAGDGARSPGTARITRYEAERVRVSTRSRRDALLVLTDSWYPGWKATVDGEPAHIHRVDYLIRGVRVPAGAHRVEFSYEPSSWRAGWIISGIALLLILVCAALGVRGWRRDTGDPTTRRAGAPASSSP